MFLLLFLLDWLLHLMCMCPAVSGGLRERSLHAMLKFEGLAAIVKLFFSLPPFLASCTVFDHILGIRLGALEM